MSYKSISISIFLMLFIYLTDQLFKFSDKNTLYMVLIFIPIISLLIIPSLSSRAKKEDLANERSSVIDSDQTEYGPNNFHNDFSRVGSADDPTPPRPHGFAGDPIRQVREELDLDLRKLEVKKGNTED